MRAKIITGIFKEIASDVVVPVVVPVVEVVGEGVVVGPGVGVGTGKNPLGSRKVPTVKTTPVVVTKSALMTFAGFGFPAEKTESGAVADPVTVTPFAWYAVAVANAEVGNDAEKAGNEKLRR